MRTDQPGLATTWLTISTTTTSSVFLSLSFLCFGKAISPHRDCSRARAVMGIGNAHGISSACSSP